MSPRFSILVPTYNREQLVRKTIGSVFSQTFSDFELIVIDDGSTDRTHAVLESFRERLKVLRQANQGPEVARSFGASAATGEYLVFLDSDDLLLPCALATYDRIIREFSSPALIIGSIYYFRDGQDVIEDVDRKDVIEVLTYRDYLAKDLSVGVSCSNIVIQRSAFRRAGGLRNSTPVTYHMDTYDMLLRFGICGPCVVVKVPATVAYRMHASNTVLDVERMVKGALSLIHAERQGQYPGGGRRRIDRYSCIGGMAWCWSKYALKAGRPKLALELLAHSSPMVMAGAFKKLWILSHGATPSLRLYAKGPGM